MQKVYFNFLLKRDEIFFTKRYSPYDYVLVLVLGYYQKQQHPFLQNHFLEINFLFLLLSQWDFRTSL